MLRTMVTTSRLDLSANVEQDLYTDTMPVYTRCTRLSACLSSSPQIGLYCAQTSVKTQVEFVARRCRASAIPCAAVWPVRLATRSLLTPNGGSVMVITKLPKGNKPSVVSAMRQRRHHGMGRLHFSQGARRGIRASAISPTPNAAAPHQPA